MDEPTEFDYLLNKMECAGQQETPGDHYYRTHRASLVRHIRALEKDAKLLAWVLAHPETASEVLEDAAAGDGTARGNLERRIDGLTQQTPHGRRGAA